MAGGDSSVRGEAARLRKRDITVSVPGRRDVAMVVAGGADAQYSAENLRAFWRSLGIVRLVWETEPGWCGTAEWYTALMYFGGDWVCSGEGATKTDALRALRSFRARCARRA